jgi:hypothetical protein
MKMNIRIISLLVLFAIMVFGYLHHELTEARFYAFSIGCEDHLPGDQCHDLAKKYIAENPTWGF